MKLIQTKDYLLLVKEVYRFKAGGWNYEKDNTISIYKFGYNINNYPGNKIIAHYPLTKETKELDLPSLPNPFKEVDVEKLVDKEASMYVEKYASYKYESYMYNECKRIFKEGYKAAQSKQFSLEDIDRAFEEGWKSKANIVGNRVKDKEAFIQSLSTQQLPKEFIISDKFNTFEENIKHGEYKW